MVGMVAFGLVGWLVSELWDGLVGLGWLVGTLL